jgi:hypothetical protein
MRRLRRRGMGQAEKAGTRTILAALHLLRIDGTCVASTAYGARSSPKHTLARCNGAEAR